MSLITDPIPASHWLSLGYNQAYADSMEGLQAKLITETMNLTLLDLKLQRKYIMLLENGETTYQSERQMQILDRIETNRHVVIRHYGSIHELPEGLLLHDECLMPLWDQFAKSLKSLSAYKNDFSLRLTIANIQLPNTVLALLEPSLAELPLDRIYLMNNMLGYCGIKFVARLLSSNPSIKDLQLIRNELENDDSAIFLTKAATEHPTLETFDISYCNIRGKEPVILAPAILSIEYVCLINTNLGSHAAVLISRSLASNPRIALLYLSGNQFGDADALLFANALMSNTRLYTLDMKNNNFTHVGIKALGKCVFDDTSLNTLHDSNSTCKLEVLADNDPALPGVNPLVLGMNRIRSRTSISDATWSRIVRAAGGDIDTIRFMVSSFVNKKIKILHALTCGEKGTIGLQYLNELPLELAPQLLVFLHDAGQCSGTNEKTLDRLFQVVRSRPDFIAPHDFQGNGNGYPRLKTQFCNAAIISVAVLMTTMASAALSGWKC